MLILPVNRQSKQDSSQQQSHAHVSLYVVSLRLHDLTNSRMRRQIDQDGMSEALPEQTENSVSSVTFDVLAV